MSDKIYTLYSNQKPANFTIDYQNELNGSQYDVVAKGDGPCLVLAGAGSGKTRTLVYRVAYLIEKGVDPERILLVTFTNKAAREMMERVQALLGVEVRKLWGGTFHSVANRILRKHAHHLGYTSNFGILDSDDSNSLIKQVQRELNVAKNKFIPKTKVIHAMISFSKNSRLSMAEVISQKYSYLMPEVVPVIERIAELYEVKKQQANVMDFDDLLQNWLRLLTHHTDVAVPLVSQFEYILVDEYQDTNRVQADIVQAMALPQNNILVVGDDAQSIYSFRAANVQNILSFQKHYPQGIMHKLEVNYRSTPEILALANDSIRHNQFQYAKQLSTPQESGQKPILVPSRDQKQQAEFIGQRILELRDENYSVNDIAVLFRSSFQMIELELELGRKGIPYIVRGGLRFFEQAHIKDVLSYVKLLQNPKEETAWRRILGMYDGVGPATVEKIYEQIKTRSLLGEMVGVLGEARLSAKAKGAIGSLQRLLIKLVNDTDATTANVIHTVLEHGYQVYAEQNFDDAKDRIEDLHQLAIFASNYETVDEFLSEAALSEGFKGDKGGSPEQDSGEILVLTTIHQAKGLEWSIVFGLGLAEGQFPHYKVLEKNEEIEEERRLFYVLVTRAKELLYLTYPVMTRSASMGDKINRPSQFVREVRPDLFDEWQIMESHQSVAYKSTKVVSDDDMQYIDDGDSGDSSTGASSILDIIRGI